MPEPSQYVIPATGAVPDVVTNTIIPTDWGNAIGAASRGRVVQRFNTAAERDSSITAPVPGMLCYVAATDLFYGYRTATGWTVLIGGPRDTLHAKVYRNAAATVGTVNGVMPWDTVQRDPQGMWTPASYSFVPPVSGIYLIAVAYIVNPVGSPASGQFAAAWIAVGGSGNLVASQGVHQSMSYGYGPSLVAALPVNAGQTVQAVVSCTYASTLQTGGWNSYMSIDYLGTG